MANRGPTIMPAAVTIMAAATKDDGSGQNKYGRGRNIIFRQINLCSN